MIPTPSQNLTSFVSETGRWEIIQFKKTTAAAASADTIDALVYVNGTC